MNAHPMALACVAVAAPLLSAQPNPSPSAASPQPRVRLLHTAQGSTARLEPGKSQESTATPIILNKMVVAESKAPEPLPEQVEPEPTQFSILRGGPISSGKISDFRVEVGLWPWTDVFSKDAKFKPPKTRVDIEVVRVKF